MFFPLICNPPPSPLTSLLPSWIYSCRSGETVSCALPSTTNVKISTSISQTFVSWEAIFHHRQPMMCLSHSYYGMPGLAPLMNVLFWARHDFHTSFSGRDMSWNVWNSPSIISMVDMGIPSNIMKSPSPKCYMTFWTMIIYSNTLHLSEGASVTEWLSSWLAEKEDRGSIPGLASWIFRDWLSPAFKSRYGWNTAEAT